MKSFVLTSLLTPQQLNEQWQRHFPFLKLQIYDFFGHWVDDFEKDKTLNEINPQEDNLRWLAVYPDMSVKAFEIAFHNKFGLSAEVFRKSGYTWDNTDYTKSWSIKKQNRKGEELSIIYKMRE
jgi:hypothetical protein